MRKQFDLKYYLEHPETKVVTRDGRGVRIICTDIKSNSSYIMLGLVLSDDGQEQVLSFRTNGMYYGFRENINDLFFDLPDPEKKRVPLTYEDLLERVANNKTMWIKGYSSNELITFFDNNGSVRFFSRWDTINNLMEEECHFADGDPCWKDGEE